MVLLLEGWIVFSCDCANHEALFGWDDRCEVQRSLFTALLMLFLFVVTSGFTAWTNLCLSEAVQSHGIAKGEDASSWWAPFEGRKPHSVSRW